MESDQKIKNEILTILKVFDKYCNDHDIKYIIAFGTLLGAVRHKGFIPWDDDIDVVMLPEEYNKFSDEVKLDPFLDDKKRYKVCLPGDENYCYSFGKVIDTKYVVREKNISDKYNIGLFIDIFRADYWPENKFKEFWQMKKGQFLRRINEVCLRGNLEGKKYLILDKLLKPVDLIFSCFGITSEKICVMMDLIATGNKPSKFAGVISEGTGSREEKKDIVFYLDTAPIQFEDSMFPAPADYDGYLRSQYGDYMKLPVPEDRIGHDFDIVTIRTDM